LALYMGAGSSSKAMERDARARLRPAYDHLDEDEADGGRRMRLPAPRARHIADIREEDLIPTEYEKRSCAGMGPRIRALRAQQARLDPKVKLGEQLSRAAEQGDAVKVSELLEQGADPNFLHSALGGFHVPMAQTKSPEVAKILIAHPDIDVNAMDLNDTSILEGWILHQHRGDNVELVRAILTHPKLKMPTAALRTCIRFASLEMLQLLLQQPCYQLNDPKVGLLHHVFARTKTKAFEIATWLLQQEGVDVNLRLQADEEARRGSLPESAGMAPLHFLSKRDSITIEIGEKEKDVYAKFHAGQVKMLQLVLQRADLDVNALDAKGNTPLHAYAHAGRLDLVQALLEDPRALPSLWHRNAAGHSAAEAAAAERDLPRERWAPAPKHAQYQACIDLLSARAEEKKRELGGLCPPELATHPTTWNMVVGSL